MLSPRSQTENGKEVWPTLASGAPGVPFIILYKSSKNSAGLNGLDVSCNDYKMTNISVPLNIENWWIPGLKNRKIKQLYYRIRNSDVKFGTTYIYIHCK